MRIELDWDPAKPASNAAKPSVRLTDVMTVFRDPLALSRLDEDSTEEERWVTLGMATAGNLVLGVHTWVETDADRTAVRIISARRPTRNEARQVREDPIP